VTYQRGPCQRKPRGNFSVDDKADPSVRGLILCLKNISSGFTSRHGPTTSRSPSNWITHGVRLLKRARPAEFAMMCATANGHDPASSSPPPLSVTTFWDRDNMIGGARFFWRKKNDVIGTYARIFRLPWREFLQSAVHYPDATSSSIKKKKSSRRFTAEGPGL
jgi:hypothetical protein